MNDCEKRACLNFKRVVEDFLGNKKDPNYKVIIADMLENLRLLGCNMSIKLHFWHAHIEFFPENHDVMSQEQGEGFHRDIKDREKRYQGKWNKNMMADYCWMFEIFLMHHVLVNEKQPKEIFITLINLFFNINRIFVYFIFHM